MENENDTMTSGVFDECRATCPYWRTRENDAGGTEHDCAHPENSPGLPTDESPCYSELCPIFFSDDEDGDYENWRTDDEIEGRWVPQDPGNEKGANYE